MKKMLSRLFATTQSRTEVPVPKRRFFSTITIALMLPLIFTTFVMSDGGGLGFACGALLTLVMIVATAVQLGTAAMQRMQKIWQDAVTH